MNAPYGQQVYFQQIRPLHECTAEDGRVVGHMLMKHSTLDSKRVFVLRTAMFRECSFLRIGDMLVALLAAAPTADAPSDCEDAPSAAEDLSSLTCEQAAALGRRLASSLHRGAGLDEAVQSHRNLCAMRSQYAWFVPMLKVLLTPKAEQLRIEVAVWLDDVTHDSSQRQNRIAAMVSTRDHVYSTMENEAIEQALAMFPAYESSSAGLKQLAHSATIDRMETKLDKATGLLLGRVEAVVRARPQEILAYMLNYDSRHTDSLIDPAVFVRCEALHVNAHHTVIFIRVKAPGISDRTFVNSIVAKRVADDPPTYVVSGVPIAQHEKLTREDEVGAVRAENCRAFRLTEAAPGITQMEYTCSLNLRGFIPQAITNAYAVPGQLHGAPAFSLPSAPASFVLTVALVLRMHTMLALGATVC